MTRVSEPETFFTRVCPHCTERIVSDARFVVWCDRCGWNVDPIPPPAKSWWATRAARSSDRKSRQLFDQMLARGTGRTTGLSAAVWTLTALVHLITLAVAGFGVIFMIEGFGLAGYVRYPIGLFMVAVGLYVQPFRRPKRQPPSGLTREQVPELFALTDEVAGALGTQKLERIQLSYDFQASYGRRPGVGGVLTLGLAMWAVLEPQERVALIGHELGHQVNGDIRRMRPVAMALRTLARWHELLRPTARSRVRGRVSNRWNPSGLIEWIILPLVLVPLTALTSAVGGLLVALSSRQGLMCEYRADQMAAQVGGTDAAVAMMEKLLVASTCMKFVTQKLRFESEIDPWAAVANYARGIPTREWERLRRVGLIRLPAVDTAHPPTQLRADLLAARTGMEARVYCDPARLAAIDEQLAPIVDQYTASVRSAIGR